MTWEAGTDEVYRGNSRPFMRPRLLYGVRSMISLDLGGGEHLLHRLPRIVSCGISLPLDEVLKVPLLTEISMPQNVFYFKFFFPVYQFRGWSKVIGSLLLRHPIGRQQQGMEDIVDGPGRGKLKLIRHWRDLLSDGKGSMMPWSELVHLIRQG